MIGHAWAKLNGAHALPLADHGADVSAVMAALLETGWASRISRCLGRPLASQEAERVCAAAYLHDMGKANVGFWKRQEPNAPLVGHLLQLLPHGCAELSRRLESVIRGLTEDAFLAMLAHHGQPIDLDNRRGEHAALWRACDLYDPLRELDAVLERAHVLFPAIAEPSANPPHPRAVALFAGLLTLADWIGSSAERFPIDGVTGVEREARSREVARRAVHALGLAAAEPLRAAAAVPFEKAFGFVPRGLQAAAGGAGERLTILEAETGSGKTEAALWRFLRLLASGEVDGLYLALPTRTSAVQMCNRVRLFLDRVFGPQAPPVVLAVPGYLQVGDVEGQRLTRWDVLWPDDPSDAVRDARWSAEVAKQFLAARIAVGTVDQALLAGLRVRHAHLRAACLSRSLLVVDEVHASDAYMTEVLAQVIENHLGAGGHAMLLSATLGSAALARLTKGRHSQPPPLPEAERLPYPALHGMTAPSVAAGGDKAVALELLGVIDDADAIAARALRAAQAGARVLVIRNTVAGAIAVQEALEAVDGPLWTVRGVPALHHGRFAAEDRRVLDEAIEAAFGKCRSEGGLVAVGTQTLEISLDLDADLMVTDLAPMDVLLQRLGRLHRHRRTRPHGFDPARAVVLVPATRDLSHFLGRVSSRHGLGPSSDTMGGVYPNLAALEATWAELQAREVLRLPSDNRVLVERATHPEALQAIVTRKDWLTFHAKMEGGRLADIGRARWNAANQTGHCLDLSIPFSELPAFPDKEEAVTTRLGACDLLLRLPDGTQGAFGLVTSIRVPEWLSRGVSLDAEPTTEICEGGFKLTLPGPEGVITFHYDRWGLRKSSEP